MDEKPAKSIYGKLAKVLAGVNRVPKNGRNNFHNYNYATESDLSECVRPLLAENNIAFIPSMVKHEKVGDYTTVEMDFTFADGDSGETVSIKMMGEAQDKGDKGLYKAYTGAVKYCLMKMFLIPTGDDPEDEGEKKPEPKHEPKPEQKPETKPEPKPEQKPDPVKQAEELFGGKEVKPEPKPGGSSINQQKCIHTIATKLKISDADLTRMLWEKCGVESTIELNIGQASKFIDCLKQLEAAAK